MSPTMPTVQRYLAELEQRLFGLEGAIYELERLRDDLAGRGVIFDGGTDAVEELQEA